MSLQNPSKRHDSDSQEQRDAELLIREALEKELKCSLSSDVPEKLKKFKLDGYCDSTPPICVEIFCHQGPSKSGQQRKLMDDMCKLLLVEKLIGQPCKKIIAVSNEAAISHLKKGSWKGQFCNAFGIELKVIPIDETTRQNIVKAQERLSKKSK